ncbi:uncharacterized protein LOC130798396 isoform X1 [Amaranthus tricolor]|uniref:uncharacterized protein LOC130798396 isoform X1 n=1 Tax=Amaranthus tricolor TaxID=29722 RepID=UPI00258E68C2|nr:uncharacterized protein LOC130798396 isoform X1 [Amaranthus tricolor]
MGIKRPRSGHDKAIVNVWQREVGLLSTRNFAHRLVASEDLVLKFDILRKLEKHRGCVNTVSFNESGDILVSGSDDRKVILWDWEIGHAKLSFHSGHVHNVFQAKFMPYSYSDDCSLVTCAADGQVRHAQISEGGRVETFLLGTHESQAHKLVIEPGSPHIFYSCGEDALVQHFDLRTKDATKLFTCRSTPERRYGIRLKVSLNAIAIDPRSPNLFGVGGSDEFARVYDIRKCKEDGLTASDQPINYYCPVQLLGDNSLNITGLAFSDQSELLVSYSDEHIYLFSKYMGWGQNPVSSSPLSTSSDFDEFGYDNATEASKSVLDTEIKSVPQVYKGHLNQVTIKGVSFFGPKSEYVVSGSDCGRIFIWRKKDGVLIRVMEADKEVVNCIEAHPHTAVLASSGIENDVKIWTPKAEKRATLPANINEVLISAPTFLFESDDSEFDEDDDLYTDSYDDDLYDDVDEVYGYDDDGDGDYIDDDNNDDDIDDDNNEDEDDIDDDNN